MPTGSQIASALRCKPRRNRTKILSVSFVVLAFASSQALTRPSFAGQNSPGGINVLANPGSPPPHLVFAADQPTPELTALLSDPRVTADLISLKAGIAINLSDLSAQRAALVRQLNRDAIPVTAWLTLPPELGYYLNAGNAALAETRFRQFETWTSANDLHWAAIGLDIEPDIRDFAAIKQESKARLFITLLGRYADFRRVQAAKRTYSALIREIQSRGYSVDTYQFPFIADERAVRSSVLQRITGILDVRGNREFLMLYSSFNPSLDSALIWVYGNDAQGIVVGSTAGPSSGPHFARLDWEEFSRDLLVAHHFSNVIGVYNLEGCVRQGFLVRLKQLDWNDSVAISAPSIRSATRLRTRIQWGLRIVSDLPYILALIALAIAIVYWRKRRLRRIARSAAAIA